jgi:beta-lactamase superfamily II metal-dependent hydrolase
MQPEARALLLILGILASEGPSEAQVGDAMRLHVIDVGQGDATLVEFPCAAILVDTGGER